ncbi:MAG: PBP1A family penicillin-binding protein [Ruminococcaceae bacterium]|nr:PBP1A family penicillin-binding protein [Oscillospiraceae bacterium]
MVLLSGIYLRTGVPCAGEVQILSERRDGARSTKRAKSKNRVWAKFTLVTLLFIGVMTTAICGLVFAIYVATNIDAKVDLSVETIALNYTSKLMYYDEKGNPQEFERLYSSQNREWADLEEMPKHLPNAAIAIEDERFRKHHGVDFKRTFGAAVNIFLQVKPEFGGSTITQQLVKNLTGDRQDTVQRKIQEIMRALYIERHFDKDTIIELYLNTIYLSEGCYGVRSAAETYFDKDVSELTLAECASLVGITNLPTYYDPFINPENNKVRQENILGKMLELKMITREEYDEAMAQELVFTKHKRTEQLTTVQSYFTDAVIEEVIDDLIETYGYSYQVAEQMLYSGGLEIYTTVDVDVQNAIEDVMENNANFPTYSTKAQPECAMVVMDPYTGDVVGLVGGRGEKKYNRVLNRATMTYRQPGSSIKPIAVYAPAIEYGLINPQSVEDDAPLMKYNNKAYPMNETRSYQGRMTITKALMESINTVSMRTLDKLTPARSFEFLTQKLGISSLDQVSDVHLAPLSLGALTKGVSVLEMAAAYSTFPNGGEYIEPRLYSKVLDNQGNVILEKKQEKTRAMSKNTAEYMNYMLGRVMSTGGTGVLAKLNKGMPAGGKTGTTDDDKDRWYVGYTPYYVGAVWYGYDNPQYIRTTLSPALTVWKKVMNTIHADLEVKQFEKSGEFVEEKVCSVSGKLPSTLCSSDVRGSKVVTGYFHKNDVPKARCDAHVAYEICAESGMKAGEYCLAKKTVSVQQLERYAPVGGVVLGDQKYTIAPVGAVVPDGKFLYAVGKEEQPITQECTLHSGTAELPEGIGPSDVVIPDDDEQENNTESEESMIIE